MFSHAAAATRRPISAEARRTLASSGALLMIGMQRRARSPHDTHRVRLGGARVTTGRGNSQLSTVLLDCFGTMVHCPWRAIRHSMADRAGVPAERLLQGYKITRQNRNTGAYPDATAELTAVCEAADLSLTAGQVRDLVRFECELLTVRGGYYPDALRFVDRVRASRIAVGLVSNCSPSATCLFERLQPHRYVDDVVLSFRVGFRKPDKRIYLTALRRLNESNPGQCLFIDDEREFCQGAEAIGITTSLIDRTRRTTGRDDTCVRTLDDLVIAGRDGLP